MNADTDIMDQIKHYAEKFMEKEYPDEAPYFPIAWDTFMRVLKDKNDDLELIKPTVRDLEGPSVVLEGDDMIMAPMVIRAFHILFTTVQRMESDNSETLKQKMVQVLSQNGFSLEFSMEIVDFFMENREDQ